MPVDDPHGRYVRSLAILTPALFVTQYLVYLCMRSWRPKLTQEAVCVYVGRDGRDGRVVPMDARAWLHFRRQTAMLAYNATFHTIFSSAFLSAMHAFSAEVKPATHLGDWQTLLVAGDVQHLRLVELAGLGGSVFGALMIHFTIIWFLRWDVEPAQLGHHVLFFGVSLVGGRRLAFSHSGIVAMAMEGSSPFLNVASVARLLDTPAAARVTLPIFLCFSILFFWLRVWAFGHAALFTLRMRLLQPEAFPAHVPLWESTVVVALWVAGWALQLYWAALIVKKAARQAQRASGQRPVVATRNATKSTKGD